MYDPRFPEYPTEIGMENWTKTLMKKDQKWFVMFTGKNCLDCKLAATDLTRLVRWAEVNESEVKIGRVDCEYSSHVCRNFDVDEYPSVLYFEAGVSFHYQGELSLDSMSTYLQSLNDKSAQPVIWFESNHESVSENERRAHFEEMASKEQPSLFDQFFRTPIVYSFNTLGLDHWSKTSKKFVFTVFVLVPAGISALWFFLFVCGFNEKYHFD